MDFFEFRSKVAILNPSKGNEIKKKYITTFIDTTRKWYFDNIATKHKCVDGDCYDGYLWDCLLNKDVISQAQIKEFALQHKDLDVYVFWDTHSCEKILIPNYWKFGKEAVIRLNFEVLLSGLNFLPEDIYIFDGTFEWTIVLTHEDIDGIPFYLMCNKK